MSSRGARGSATVVLAILAACAAAPAIAQAPPTLDELGFLAGCWTGTTGALRVEEQWTRADGGVMLGTTRFHRDGRVVDWEFARLVEDGTGVTLWPYPRGVISEHGFPLVRTDGEYVFENLEHDFPVRIVYARIGTRSLRPRIEGHDGRGPSWALERVDCPG